jgi:argininosuccinate synthase
MLKDALTRWVAPSVTGEVDARAAARRRLHHPRHARRLHVATRRTSCRWRRSRTRPFTPEDRIGALELQNLSVGDNRALLMHHFASVSRLAAGPGAPGIDMGKLLDEGTK